MTPWIIYLIIINILGFGIEWICAAKHRYQEWLLVLVAAAGGPFGMLVAMLLFDRKAEKENMLSHVFCICAVVILPLVYLLIRKLQTGHLNLDFWRYFAQHKELLIYLIVINVVTFVVYGIDKYLAIKEKSRIPIITLLGMAFAGGSIGGLVAMYGFHHKTKKAYFTIGVPLMLFMQILILLYLVNIVSLYQ